MRKEVKSMIVFGLTLDVLIIGGTILARSFYNAAPTEFHRFVEMSLWATVAAVVLCLVFIFQFYKMMEKIKKIHYKTRSIHHTGLPKSPSKKSQRTNNSAFLGVLIIAPGAFVIIPFIHGSVVFAHDYIKLAREFVVFVALWFCYRLYAITKKSL